MKTTSSNIWKSALWIWSAAILGFLAFGAAVKVDFVDPAVPLGQAVESLDWSRAVRGFQQREFLPTLLAAVAVLLIVTFSSSWKVRLGILATGFLTPLFMEGPVMLGIAAASPLMMLGMVAGTVDGEFYCEGMPLVAAAGLWMQLCLVYGIREIVLLLKQRKRGDTGAIKPLDHPLP